MKSHPVHQNGTRVWSLFPEMRVPRGLPGDDNLLLHLQQKVVVGGGEVSLVGGSQFTRSESQAGWSISAVLS
jgi:hypothetical protein